MGSDQCNVSVNLLGCIPGCLVGIRVNIFWARSENMDGEWR